MSHTTNGSDHLQEPTLRYPRQDFPIIRDSVTVEEAVQDACEMFVKHKFFAFPIVDDLNHMRGSAEQIVHLKMRPEVFA